MFCVLLFSALNVMQVPADELKFDSVGGAEVEYPIVHLQSGLWQVCVPEIRTKVRTFTAEPIESGEKNLKILPWHHPPGQVCNLLGT
jgi:hypothetical protein